MVSAPLMPQHWPLPPLCAQTDPDIFFPKKGSPTTAAREICAHCTAIDYCRDYTQALADELGRFPGIWAGLSEKQREQARRQQQVAA